ncbi:TRAM domain-containing protein [Candidatus Woesearchaeota archaeon]|nr:TRAM domain-containing protein [Candidatus Woesearchaeota archaeon]
MHYREGGQGGAPGDVPVNEGDELEVNIEAVGEKGDGIAKKDGFVLFVPNTKEGEAVKVRVTKVLRKVGFAEVIGRSESPGQPEKSAPQAPQQEEHIEDTEDFGEEPEESQSSESEMPEPPEEEKDFVDEETEEVKQ